MVRRTAARSTHHAAPKIVRFTFGLVAALSFGGWATGCALEADATDERPETVDRKQQEFSSFGIERVIPLRVIQATNDCNTYPNDPDDPVGYPSPAANWHVCSPCSDGTNNCGPDTVSFEDIRSAVEGANFALRALGVQVHVSRIEKYALPTFYMTCNPSDICNWKNWNSVKNDLQKVYPGYMDSSGNDFAEISWLSRAKQAAGDPSQIDVIVPYYNNGGEGRRPSEGPASLAADSWLFERPRALAHEIGHIIGLEHPMPPEQHNVRDPTEPGDFDPAPLSEYWDLVVGGHYPYFNPVFFSNRSEAEQFTGYITPKMRSWASSHNCTVDTNCTLTCDLGVMWNNTVQVTTGDAGARGLAFTFDGDYPQSGIYSRGFNTMMYMDNPYPDGRPYCEMSSFSDSQAEHVKKVLRSDIESDAWWLGFNPGDGVTSQRYALGTVKSLTGFDRLDLDGDGKRDIAIWEPVGYFYYRSSSSGYASGYARTLGLTGDVPVPADYDGDGTTDLAVVRRGGMDASDPYDSQLHWIWCTSTISWHPQYCGSGNNGYGSQQWGYQYDVPLPGLEFDGNVNTKEIAVYRPTNGYVYWQVVGSSTYGAIYTGFEPHFTTLHGLYDSDNKTDLVAYDPDGHEFILLLSSQSWSTSQKIVRTAASSLAPDGGYPSTPAERFGGVPVVAEKNGRRVLRIWDAYTATWYTNWNPLTSNSFQSCQMGTIGDVPLSGPIDADLNGYSDFALFRPTGLFSPLIWTQRPSSTSCNLGGGVVSLQGTSRLNVSAVRDMDSLDGRGDFLVLDPDKNDWTRYVSQSNGTFYTQSPLNFGTVGSIGL
jgi:hypothetical protein